MEGPRIGRDELAGKPVIHNYGPGGAGVTLSWGATALVERRMPEVLRPTGSKKAALPGVATHVFEHVGQ